MSKLSSRRFSRAIAAVFSIAALTTSQHAAASFIAAADTISGGLSYVGLGETAPGSNIGTGRVQIGDCVFDGTNTVCTTTGTYTEDAASSVAPGDTGTFILTQTYSGDGPSPALGQSTEEFGDFFNFFDVGDAIFELMIMTSGGETLGGIFPDDPFSDSIGFFVEVLPGDETCTGLSAMVTCSLGQVGLVAGATFSGVIGLAGFTIPDSVLAGDPTTAVPLPAAAWLMIAGLGGLRLTQRKKSR